MKTENQSTLHQILKLQTTELHKKAHDIPYIANLLNNDIPLISYAGHIRAFSIIYEALENQILNPENEVLSDFLNDYSPRLPLLLTDLEYLKTKDDIDIVPENIHAGYVAEKELQYNKANQYKLLGFIYTMEGSLNGGSILKEHVKQTFKFVNNHGTMYLSSFDDKTKMFWHGFINKLNTKIVENKHKDDVIAGAREIFIDIIKIYESLTPVDEETVVK